MPGSKLSYDANDIYNSTEETANYCYLVGGVGGCWYHDLSGLVRKACLEDCMVSHDSLGEAG